MYSKSRLSKIQKKNEQTYEKMVYAAKYKEWDELDLPDPFEIVKDFIKEKGLKLYGGKALDDHLKKRKALYGKNEFPDYDVLQSKCLGTRKGGQGDYKKQVLF